MEEREQTPSAEVPQTAGLAEGLGSVLSDPELMAKLPQVMAMLRPMMEGAMSGGGAEPVAKTDATPKKGPPDDRSALLLALKPFLSEDRKQAVDAILRISALGDVLRKL